MVNDILLKYIFFKYNKLIYQFNIILSYLIYIILVSYYIKFGFQLLITHDPTCVINFFNIVTSVENMIQFSFV